MIKFSKKENRIADKKAERIAAGIITPEEAQRMRQSRHADTISADGLIRLASVEWSKSALNQLKTLITLYTGLYN